jgi:hypothetical protein
MIYHRQRTFPFGVGLCQPLKINNYLKNLEGKIVEVKSNRSIALKLMIVRTSEDKDLTKENDPSTGGRFKWSSNKITAACFLLDDTKFQLGNNFRFRSES